MSDITNPEEKIQTGDHIFCLLRWISKPGMGYIKLIYVLNIGDRFRRVSQRTTCIFEVHVLNKNSMQIADYREVVSDLDLAERCPRVTGWPDGANAVPARSKVYWR